MEEIKNSDDFNVHELSIGVIPTNIAKSYTLKNHYMRTFPNAVVCFGVMYRGVLSGVVTFGYSAQSEAKIKKIIPNIQKKEFIEQLRMNLLDTLGKNAESHVMSRCMRLLQGKGIKAVITHAGGCKNDCGIVYQSSGWLYFGKEKCEDFYLTEAGEYKNIIAPLMFGRVPKGVKGKENIGYALFGKGAIVHSYRYTYIYPINKGLRGFLQKSAKQYPKDTEHWRKDQKWIS
jgi:hypothetical protein